MIIRKKSGSFYRRFFDRKFSRRLQQATRIS